MRIARVKMQDWSALTEKETCFFPTCYVFSFLVLFAPPSSLPGRGGTGCFPESL